MKIKLRFQNGLTFEGFKKEVFDIEGLSSMYQFEESDEPDFIIFGPYGNDIPPRGKYVRIGYFCENVKPDFSICDWAFGVPREEDINRSNYKRIQWHGVDPHLLIKPSGYDAEKILASKTKFCNFLYSNKVPFREAFFKRLSKYKKVDSPGTSMNNMPTIDKIYRGSKWHIKRQFLAEYKFTVAFENDISPGYQTEKLYDPMIADSIPIYCGDPFIGDTFNTNSFINSLEYVPQKNIISTIRLDKVSRMDFEDMRPAHFNDAKSRLKRKAKSLMRGYKGRVQFGNKDFDAVIDRIIEADEQPGRYLKYLNEPWFKNNSVPDHSSTKKRWMEIFNTIK